MAGATAAIRLRRKPWHHHEQRALGLAALRLCDDAGAEHAHRDAIARFSAIPSALWIARTPLDRGDLARVQGERRLGAF